MSAPAPALHAPALHTPARPGPAMLDTPAGGVVDVWFLPIRYRAGWVPLLSAAERDRLTALDGSPAAASLVTSRAGQRLITARYLGADPRDVQPVRTCGHCADPGHGRPHLPGAPFDFSVSHSARWLMVAVAGSGPVGADVDTLDDRRPLDGLARVALGPAEQAAFRETPGPARRAAFLTAWTRKEAAVKLTGHGLAVPPARVDVSGPYALTAGVPGWPDPPPRLTTVDAPAGHVAALATSGLLTGVRRRTGVLRGFTPR